MEEGIEEFFYLTPRIDMDLGDNTLFGLISNVRKVGFIVVFHCCREIRGQFEGGLYDKRSNSESVCLKICSIH